MTGNGQPAFTDTRYRVGVYGWSPQSGGVHHYRIAEPLRVLADQGTNAQTGTVLDDAILSETDHILVHQIHDESSTEAWHRLAKLQSHKLIMDVDDAMWRPDWTPFKDHYTRPNLDRLYANVAAAHVVTTPSPLIAEHLTRYNRNVWILPNTVPAWLLTHRMPARDMPMIGYQGSPSHARDWTTSQLGNLIRFLNDHPAWGLQLYGSAPGDLASAGDRVRHTPWIPDVESYYRQLSFDIGVGPLRPTLFNRHKSSIRAVEYAALGIVAVLPDLDPYRGWIDDGVTGRLISSGQTLRRVLTEVAGDLNARITMAANARTRAAGWTTEANIDKWVTAWANQS